MNKNHETNTNENNIPLCADKTIRIDDYNKGMSIKITLVQKLMIKMEIMTIVLGRKHDAQTTALILTIYF